MAEISDQLVEYIPVMLINSTIQYSMQQVSNKITVNKINPHKACILITIAAATRLFQRVFPAQYTSAPTKHIQNIQELPNTKQRVPLGEIAVGVDGDLVLVPSDSNRVTKCSSFTADLDPLEKKFLQ